MSEQQVKSKRDQIQKLKEQNSKMQLEIAKNNSKISKNNSAISKTKSQATIKSKLRENERLSKRNNDLDKKMGDNLKKEAQYNKQLTKLIATQDKERQKSFDDALRKIELQKNIAETESIASFSHKADEAKEWDVFLSHASEDKADFATPLANELTNRNVKVWYDQFKLDWGDSLMRKINEGISNSKFGIVVLSSSFFEKDWPQQELDALFSKEMLGNKTILPIWHNVSKEEVAKHCPLLLGSLALKTTDYTVSEICDKLELLLDKHEDGN